MSVELISVLIAVLATRGDLGRAGTRGAGAEDFGPSR